ncbi:Uncharacterised protein [uncultured archaeon]|nr:Uncharacterised protein [uncultured archaeon]
MNLEKSLFKKIRNTAAAIVMSSVFFGCPNPNSPAPSVQEPPHLTPNAIVLPEYNSQKISSVAPDSITLSQKIDSLSPGKIIISDITPTTPQGLLRKVTGVSSDGKTLITENASLEEVVDNYSFSSAQELTPSDVRSVVLSKGISPRLSAEAFNFKYDLNNVVLYDIDGDLKTTDDQINANGNISFNSKFDLEFKIENFELENLTFKNITTDSINITANSPTKFLDTRKTYKIIHYDFKPFVIGTIPTIPPIPIIVTPKLDVDLEVYIKSSSLITATLTQNADLTLGVSYSDNSWAPINIFNNNFNFQKPTLPDEVNLGVIPSQELSLWLYDRAAGLYGKLSEYADFSSYKTDKIRWQIYAGLFGDIGIDMGIFKKFIPSYSKRVLQYDKLIDSGEIQISLPAPIIHTAQIQPGIEGKDAYIRKNGIPNYNYNNNSIVDIHYFGYDENYLEVLNWSPSMTQFEYEDALIDFLNLPLIPNNSQISSAKIKLYGSGFTNYLTNPTIRLKKINSDWGERNVVWNDSLIGGEEISNSVVGDEGWYEWDVTSLVRDWKKGIPNYGIALYTNGGQAKFCSSEYPDSTKRPILEISYY